jgi:hypothetical protein
MKSRETGIAGFINPVGASARSLRGGRGAPKLIHNSNRGFLISTRFVSAGRGMKTRSALIRCAWLRVVHVRDVAVTFLPGVAATLSDRWRVLVIRADASGPSRSFPGFYLARL